MHDAVAPPTWLRVLYWFKAMPDWFKAVALGGAVALLGLMVVLWATDGWAEEVADLKARVSAVEAEDLHTKDALRRIESKLDQLILELIGG
jgi:hypothetical protein